MNESAIPNVGLRERKKLQTRRTIRGAALDLAIELGLENLTVEAIADAANISPRTFFNYFAHKEDALVTDAAAVAVALRPHIVARPSHESPLHVVRAVITEYDPFSLVNADRQRALARQKLVQENPRLLARQLGVYAILEAELAQAVAERLDVDPEADLRPALVASVAAAAMRVAVRRWTADDSAQLTELLVACFDELEGGLLAAGTDTD
ncbi:MAG: TetR/AcrR family transcriptional regulator [Nesterenkonia sp.]